MVVFRYQQNQQIYAGSTFLAISLFVVVSTVRDFFENRTVTGQIAEALRPSFDCSGLVPGGTNVEYFGCTDYDEILAQANSLAMKNA